MSLFNNSTTRRVPVLGGPKSAISRLASINIVGIYSLEWIQDIKKGSTNSKNCVKEYQRQEQDTSLTYDVRNYCSDIACLFWARSLRRVR